MTLVQVLLDSPMSGDVRKGFRFREFAFVRPQRSKTLKFDFPHVTQIPILNLSIEVCAKTASLTDMVLIPLHLSVANDFL